jgi:Tat protein translocase TatB subunit
MMLLFFNMSGGEMLVIVVVAYLVLGPKKIPEVARMIGKGMNELRRATDDIRNEITKEVNNIKKDVNVDLKETIIPDVYRKPPTPPAEKPAPTEPQAETKKPEDDLR